MAYGNASYGDFDASVVGSGMAYGVEAQLQQTWEKTYLTSHPTLEKIFKHGDAATVMGPKLLVPAWFSANTAVAGVLRADEDTTSFTPDGGKGTQLEIQWTKYVANHAFTDTQIDEYAKSKQSRGRLIAGRADELAEAFMVKLITDMSSSQNAAQNIILGLPYAVTGSSGANTLHGIDRSDADNANFRGNVTATVGVITEEILDGDIETLFREKKSNPDLIIAAKSSTIDIYSKIKSFLRGNELVTRNVSDGGTKYRAGYSSVEYRGLELVRDHYAVSGTAYILDSSSWGWWGDKAPTKVGNMNRLDSKLYYEQMYKLTCALYCKNPRKNWKYTGITG